MVYFWKNKIIIELMLFRAISKCRTHCVKATKDNYLQLYLLLESDFTELVDLSNAANSIQIIGLTFKLRENLSFLI